jgi:hypothetical protein
MGLATRKPFAEFAMSGACDRFNGRCSWSGPVLPQSSLPVGHRHCYNVPTMRCFVFSFAFWLPFACSAQLTGELTYHFADNPPLWDFTATYSRSNGTLELENTLVHAPSGALVGTGSVHYKEGFTHLDAAHAVQGRASGSATTRITVNAVASGQFSGTALGRSISGPFNGTIALVLDSTNRALRGTESGKLCAQGIGCRTLVTNVNFQLPPDMDGTWTLTLDITTSKNAVRGTAVILLSNGRVVSFNARGRYRAVTGLTRLTLVGTRDAFGVSLPLQLNADQSVKKLGGKLFGQRLVLR